MHESLGSPNSMSRRIALIVVPALLAGAAFATAIGAREAEPKPDPLLVSGGKRYAAYVRAERASMQEMVAVGDGQAARIHRERLRPASVAAGLSSEAPKPIAVASAASSVLSLDGRRAGEVALLDVESHVAGSGVAFDAVRDALWARDKGLVGSIDERIAGLRTELDRHRRGAGFVPARSLRVADRRRLAAALDALAWRLELAAEKLG
jgi:iron uptake system EfeUOB component EfeO/EfeM